MIIADTIKLDKAKAWVVVIHSGRDKALVELAAAELKALKATMSAPQLAELNDFKQRYERKHR